MRDALCILGLLAGCEDQYHAGESVCGDGRADIGEECDDDSSACGPDCKKVRVNRQVHWLFESRNNGTRLPCLPGSPAVEVWVGPSGGWFDCELGMGATQTFAFDHDVRVSSGGVESATIPTAPNDLDLPTVVAYSDGGYVRAHWRVDDYLGTPDVCTYADSVYLRVDDLPPKWQSTTVCTEHVALVGPLTPGVHSLRAQVTRYDTMSMSSSVDVTAANDEVVDSPLLVIVSP